MPQPDRKTLLAEEALIVRHSGEIPEIAFHGSLYYLTEDPEGPAISLTDQELDLLTQQAVARYKEIIFRDLTPENRDKTIYRGIKRTLFNWQRLKAFCERNEISMTDMHEEVGEALISFFHQEMTEVGEGRRNSSINCTAASLENFIKELGLQPDVLPPG